MIRADTKTLGVPVRRRLCFLSSKAHDARAACPADFCLEAFPREKTKTRQVRRLIACATVHQSSPNRQPTTTTTTTTTSSQTHHVASGTHVFPRRPDSSPPFHSIPQRSLALSCFALPASSLRPIKRALSRSSAASATSRHLVLPCRLGERASEPSGSAAPGKTTISEKPKQGLRISLRTTTSGSRVSRPQ